MWAVLMLLGLALGLAGCGGGVTAEVSDPRPWRSPPPSGPPLEELATLNLLDLYRTAVVRDIDQHRPCRKAAEGGVEEVRSVLSNMSEIFQFFAVIDLQLQEMAIRGSPTPRPSRSRRF